MNEGSGKGLIVDVPVSFTGKAVQDLVVQVRRLLASVPESLTFDFKDTGMIDSCGIGQLVAIARELQTMGSAFTLRNLNSDVRQLFEDTGIDQIFNIEGSKNNAMDPFTSSIDIKLDIAFEIEGDVSIMKLGGVMNNQNSSRYFKQQFLLQLAQHRKILVDMTELTFIDSGGVGALVDMHHLLSKTAGQLRVCGANCLVEDLFTTLNLKIVLPLYKGCEEAMASWK